MDRYFELSESETFKMVCPFPVTIECLQRDLLFMTIECSQSVHLLLCTNFLENRMRRQVSQ